MIQESVALALDIDCLAMVQNPVWDKRGNDRITGEFLPVRVALVRRDDCRTLLVAAGGELEEEIRLMTGDRETADHMNDDSTGVEMGLALGLALFQLGDQGVPGGEIGAEALITCFEGRCGGKMGFADSRRGEEDDVFVPGRFGSVRWGHAVHGGSQGGPAGRYSPVVNR